MRLPGIGEIILIFVIGVIVIIGVRVFGAPSPKKPRRKPQYYEEEDDEEEEEEEDEDVRIKHHRRSRTQILGIGAILVGIIILISTLSMIKWVFWGPIGAFVIIAIGILTIFLARRR